MVWVCGFFVDGDKIVNNMGMTEVLQFEGGFMRTRLCPRNSKGLKNILNGVFLKI